MSSSSLSIRLVRHLCTSSSSAAKAQALNSLSFSKAIHKLRTEDDPDKALELYSYISSKNHNTSLSSAQYVQTLTVLCLTRARRFDAIETFIEALKKDPKITKEIFLCPLIRCYGRAGMFDHALNTYNQMDELGTPRSVESFNALLAACNHSERFDRVPQLFDELPKRYGFVPDRFSYGLLVKAYCGLGSHELALKTLEEMEEKGVEVTNVLFTIIMDTLYKKGITDEADRVWDEMVSKGFSPDVVAYNVRISHLHGGEPEGVKALIDEMTAAGLKPDPVSYNYLLTSYCINGRVEEAMKLFKELEASGLKSKVVTFKTLIDHLSKNGDFEKGYYVFKRSVFHRKIPEFATLKVLAEGLVAKKKLEDAKGLIRTVKKKLPQNLTNAWKEVELEFGLVSEESSPDTPGAQEAAT